MVETRQMPASWYTGPITSVLFLDEELLVAACGRSLILFSTQSRELIAKQDSCLPVGMKITGLERASSPRSFIVITERTFAVYSISEQS